MMTKWFFLVFVGVGVGVAGCEPVEGKVVIGEGEGEGEEEVGEGEGEGEGEGGEGEGEGETGLEYDIHAATNRAVLTWSDDMPSFAGYSATFAGIRFYIADPLGDGVSAYIYGIRWSASGTMVLDTDADSVITTGAYGPDKMDFERGWMSIPDAAADVADVPGAGIGYSLPEPHASGVLSDVAPISVAGDTEEGYAARILRLDADGDGAVDDMVATQSTYDSEEVHGELAVFFDSTPARPYFWGEADVVVPACIDTTSSRISYGPVDLASDALDDVVWIACPSSNYKSGTLETLALPVDRGSSVETTVMGVSGWAIDPDPRGGVWAAVQGDNRLVYARASGESLDVWPEDVEGGSMFGSAPSVVQASTGQVFLATGQMTRTAAVPAGEESGSAAYICDITVLPDEEGGVLDCERYEAPEGLPCVGAVQGAAEIADSVYFFSSGWLYGSGDGCGAALWQMIPM